ncbi:MAG: hypothetical protein AB1635_14425 [Acidobacteriota bacterium]
MTTAGLIVGGLLAALTMVAAPRPAAAQSLDGYAALVVDAFPAVRVVEGAPAEPFAELRARLFVNGRVERGPLRLTASGFVEGLVRRHPAVFHALAASGVPAAGVTDSALVRPEELHAELSWPAADLRVGYTRIVWGRLDEFQPTDVVSPLDLTRFFFEGRAEGRRPLPLVRARWFPSDDVTMEGIFAPVFRPGTFDELDEATAPLNAAPPNLVAREPATAWQNVSGGGRVQVTSGRVDWAVSAYRGFEAFPTPDPIPFVPAVAGASPTLAFVLPASHRRQTMVGADFETVRGQWGLRGEAALIAGRSFQAGAGVDRRAGAYRLAANVVGTRDWDADRREVSLVGVVDRSFARETRALRVLGVYNPVDGSAFARASGTLTLRDGVQLELAGGVFSGAGDDALSRFASRDFVFARLRVFY